MLVAVGEVGDGVGRVPAVERVGDVAAAHVLGDGVGLGAVDGAPGQGHGAVARRLDAGLGHWYQRTTKDVSIRERSPMSIDICLDEELIIFPILKSGYGIARFSTIVCICVVTGLRL